MDRNMYSRPRERYSQSRERHTQSTEEYARSIERRFGPHFKRDILSLEQLEPSTYNKLIDELKDYLKPKVKKISASQLRNVYSVVKKCKNPKDLMLVRPKLAYVAGRAENNETKELVFLLEELIKHVDDNTKLKNLQSFFEAIIAYHKYFGGGK